MEIDFLLFQHIQWMMRSSRVLCQWMEFFSSNLKVGLLNYVRGGRCSIWCRWKGCKLTLVPDEKGIKNHGLSVIFLGPVPQCELCSKLRRWWSISSGRNVDVSPVDQKNGSLGAHKTEAAEVQAFLGSESRPSVFGFEEVVIRNVATQAVYSPLHPSSEPLFCMIFHVHDHLWCPISRACN